VIMSPSPNIGDVSPMSHRDRRPCTHYALTNYTVVAESGGDIYSVATATSWCCWSAGAVDIRGVLISSQSVLRL